MKKWPETREMLKEDLLVMSEYLPSNSDDKSDLGLSLDEEVSSLLGGSLALDQVSIGLVVLGVVFLGVFLGLGSGSLSIGLGFGTSVGECLGKLGISGLLLENVFGHNSGSKHGC